MGLGAALQQLGGMYLQRNFQRQDDARQQQIEAKRRAEDEALWRDRQAYLARLNPPQERVRQVYDEQRRNALAVREQWQPGSDASQGPPSEGRWVETGRDVLPPEPGKIQTFRQGDEEVTAMIDPRTGAIKEIGRGNAFSPKQRGGGSGAGGSSTTKGLDTKGAPSGYAWNADRTGFMPVPGGPRDKPATEPDAIKLNSGDRKNIATTRQKLGTLDAIENQLNNVESLFEPLKGSWSAGGAGQGRLPTEAGKKFDAAVAQLSPLMRQLTRVPGEGAVSDYETQLLERASLNRSDYESTTAEKLKAARELVNEMRKAHAMSLETYGLGPDGKPLGSPKAANQPAGGGYRIGDVITEGGKRYKVIGGTPDDPEVEPL